LIRGYAEQEQKIDLYGTKNPKMISNLKEINLCLISRLGDVELKVYKLC
jgi:hypothetical protein